MGVFPKPGKRNPGRFPPPGPGKGAHPKDAGPPFKGGAKMTFFIIRPHKIPLFPQDEPIQDPRVVGAEGVGTEGNSRA